MEVRGSLLFSCTFYKSGFTRFKVTDCSSLSKHPETEGTSGFKWQSGREGLSSKISAAEQVESAFHLHVDNLGR